MASLRLKDIGLTLRSAPFGPFGGFARTPGRTDGPPDDRGVDFRLHDVNLAVPDGRTMVILGPSGCGKSTILRIVAGIVRPDEGEVLYGDVPMDEVPTKERGIGMVFQNYALYPTYTAKQNILSWFLFRKKTPELDAEAEQRFRRTSELLDVSMDSLLDRKPPTLSGGEKQRVAIGRCITRDPKLFLLDEPFSNLDRALRETYRTNLKRLLRAFGITTLYVTHDHREAVILGDLIAVMDVGRIAQVGSYADIYDEPADLHVAGFVSLDDYAPAINTLPSGVLGGDAAEDAVLAFRPDKASVRPFGGSTGGVPSFAGTVEIAEPHPAKPRGTIYRIAAGGRMVTVCDEGDALRPGTRAAIVLKRFHLYDGTSGTLLSTRESGGPGS